MADIRPPAVAGMFYPSDPAKLREDVGRYLAAASVPALQGVRAVVAPHAGFVYSGPVAAFAYQVLALQKSAPERILLLGPSHRTWFPGVAVADVDGFSCPLGTHLVDREYVRRLTAERDLFTADNRPHGPEHCLEVHIPFLRVVLPDAPVVPMLFGQVDPVEVGRSLLTILEDNDLVIVSSDLSHYHSNRAAHTTDRQFLDALLAGDRAGVLKGEACGQAPALAMMVVAAARGWRPQLLDYRTSGDISGETRQVVGYAAVAYTEEA